MQPPSPPRATPRPLTEPQPFNLTGSFPPHLPTPNLTAPLCNALLREAYAAALRRSAYATASGLTLAEQAKNRFKIAVDAELAQVGCPPVTIAVVAVAVDCCSDVILTFVVAGTSQVLLIQGGAGQNQRQPVPAGEEQDASY